MNVLYFLVPLALLLAGIAVFGFIWAVRRGQYDDVHTPALRMLVDDEESHAHEQGKTSQGVETHQDDNPADRPA